MKIYNLTHSDFGKTEVLAKFRTIPSSEEIETVLNENFNNLPQLHKHSKKLLHIGASSIQVGEWLELIEGE